jgi:membrane-bound lytic murein transglycosylase D
MLRSKFAKVLFISLALLFIAAPGICYLQQKDNVSFSDENIDTASASSIAHKAPLNKHAVKFVRDYIQKNNEDLSVIRQRSKYPFDMMDAVFKSYNLPVELKYLAVIESELKTSALSRVGAAGPWQLMPATAKILGLKVSSKYDERRQYKKSTKAAAMYLRDLYAEYGDWLLVLAAYNGGPGPVNNAIRKSGSRNFWCLQNYLPAESREHVKKFIATHYYFEGQGSITTLTRAEGLQYTRKLAAMMAKQAARNPANHYMIAKDSSIVEKTIAARF